MSWRSDITGELDPPIRSDIIRSDIDAVRERIPTASREYLEQTLRVCLAHIEHMREALGVKIYETVTFEHRHQ